MGLNLAHFKTQIHNLRGRQWKIPYKIRFHGEKLGAQPLVSDMVRNWVCYAVYVPKKTKENIALLRSMKAANFEDWDLTKEYVIKTGCLPCHHQHHLQDWNCEHSAYTSCTVNYMGAILLFFIFSTFCSCRTCSNSQSQAWKQMEVKQGKIFCLLLTHFPVFLVLHWGFQMHHHLCMILAHNGSLWKTNPACLSHHFSPLMKVWKKSNINQTEQQKVQTIEMKGQYQHHILNLTLLFFWLWSHLIRVASADKPSSKTDPCLV